MKNLMKIGALILASALTLAVVAQPDPRGREDESDCERKLRREMRAYVGDNILPVIKRHRRQLDKVMSNEDKRKVAELRKAAEELREAYKQLKKRIRRSGEEPSAEARKRMEQLHLRRMKIGAAAKEIALKYFDEIDRLQRSIRNEYADDWRSGMRRISNKYKDDCGDEIREGMRERRRRFRRERREHDDDERERNEDRDDDRDRERDDERDDDMHRDEDEHDEMDRERRRHHPIRRKLRRLRSIEGFLLFDPAKDIADDNSDRDDAPTREAVRNLKVSPNPTNGQATITYTVEADARIRVELADRSGNNALTVYEGTASEGKNRHSIDAGTLENGVYFVKVTNGDRVSMTRFVVAN